MIVHLRNPLVAWAVERESIRLKKEAGLPAPWTDDPILQTYRFTNLRRRDDRVSRWLREHVLTVAHVEAGLPNFLAFSGLCRWVNWPPTIQLILDAGLYPAEKINWRKIGKLIDAIARTDKAWTGAYMVRADTVTHMPKGQYVAEKVTGESFKIGMVDLLSALLSRSRANTHAVVNGFYGWGSFMSGQIVDDWTWTSVLKGATDNASWAPLGPGSIRGFNRLMKRSLKQRPTEYEFCELLVKLRQEIIDELGPDYDDITAMDVQNCLCEFDKYQRVKLGEGRPRSQYAPETRY